LILQDLLLDIAYHWSCLILVKNHLAGSCKFLQDLLLDLAYSSILQALARSCLLLSLSMSSCKNMFLEKCKKSFKKSCICWDIWPQSYWWKTTLRPLTWYFEYEISREPRAHYFMSIAYLKALGFIFNKISKLSIKSHWDRWRPWT
jgi:hypothetical protein